MSLLNKIVRKISETAEVARAFLRGSEKIDGVHVYGRQEFRSAIVDALLLLRDHKLPAWHTLTRHVGSILEGTRTVVIVTAHPALIVIDGQHARQDPAFLAGTIAHLTCSCDLHRTYEGDHPGRRVPRDVYYGSAAQERCNEAYRECLVALGKAPRET